jgi:hypothetical protein
LNASFHRRCRGDVESGGREQLTVAFAQGAWAQDKKKPNFQQVVKELNSYSSAFSISKGSVLLLRGAL